MHQYLDVSNRADKPMKKRNVSRFAPLKPGDKVIVTAQAKMPTIRWAKGRVISVQDNDRSPYKNLCKVWLEGSMKYGNPWFVFRNEIEKIDNGNEKGN